MNAETLTIKDQSS